MNALRWVLASATTLVMIGFIALVVMAEGFRRSFGASEIGPLIVVLPLLAMLVFLSTLLWPGHRLLLHLGAAMGLILAACSVWVLRESIFIGVMGLIYSGLWGIWYWQTAWGSATTP